MKHRKRDISYISRKWGVSPNLSSYLEEIADTEPLPPEEEIRLSQLIKQGDKDALNKMLCANLRFVVSIAKKYQNRGLPLEDLINIGNLGLIKAAHRYDESRGFKFISYAVWWIRQTILQALAEQSRTIRIPLTMVSIMNKYAREMEHLEQTYEREPNFEELAQDMDINQDTLEKTLQLNTSPLSVDAPVRDESDSYFLDIIEDEDADAPDSELMDESLKFELHDVLKNLTDREQKIIKMYYGLENYPKMTLEEIGEKVNLTRERVRQIKEKGILKLRHISRARLLQKFLG
ncbi:MAG: DNA-directed RNA polymerase sigma subunit RpoD [Marinimicrobia bacterium 46_47]|nr:MAG: DNA-directed RNA polymerase sigma subunit RpoD [Marinimicrobia bacterium 46_47]HBY18729.1 RNA polymerase subunit sigma [Candidatus Neomarinimicrobiota bacterium]